MKSKHIDAKLNKDLTVKIAAFAVVLAALIATLFLTLKSVVVMPLKQVTKGLKDIAQVMKTSDDILARSSEVSENALKLAALSKYQNEVVSRFKI